MGKNIMKSNRVAVLIMIMLGFVQILEIEAVNLPCRALCDRECLASKQPYIQCYVNCIEKKRQMSITESNCATSCA